jgi:hypothetical protein
MVTFRLARKMLLVSVSSSAFNGTETLHYESLDCTGAAVAGVFDPGSSLFLPTAIRGPGSTLFLFDTSQPPVTIQKQSTLLRNGDGTETCLPGFPGPTTGFPPIPTGIDLQQLFTPPYRLADLDSGRSDLP